MSSRDERVLRWTGLDPAELDEATDDDLEQRAGKRLRCRRTDCTNDALAPLVVASSIGPRWVDLCADCALVLAAEVGPECTRGACDRAAPADRSSGGWCPHCCGRLHSSLAHADAQRVALLDAAESLAPSLSQAAGSVVSGSRTPPAPLSIGRASLADDLLRLYTTVEDHLRDQLGAQSAIRWVRMGDRTVAVRESAQWSRALAYVRAGWAALLVAEAGRLLAEQLMAMTISASRALGTDRLVHRLEAPCPSCNALSLRRFDGADRVECEMCGRTETEETYAWLAKAAVDAYDQGDTGRVRSSLSSDGDVTMRAYGTGGAA